MLGLAMLWRGSRVGPRAPGGRRMPGTLPLASTFSIRQLKHAVPPWTEQWQHFVSEATEQFWGDLCQRTRGAWAYGIRADGRRELLAFTWSRGESQAAWKGLLNDLYRRSSSVVLLRSAAARGACMVCFVNVKSVGRILYAIFNRFNLERAQRTLPAFAQAA